MNVTTLKMANWELEMLPFVRGDMLGHCLPALLQPIYPKMIYNQSQHENL